MTTQDVLLTRSDDSASVTRVYTGVFVLLSFVYPLLVWAFPYFPSQDGPIHLAITQTLADYDNPSYPAMAQYFGRDFSLQRNPLIYLVLGTLARVMPLLVAEKVYLTVIVALLPLSLLYALRGVTQHALYPAFFAFPLTYGYALKMGFYSFSLGVSLFLLTVGLWLRCRRRWTAWHVILFGAATFVTYVCHIFAAFNVVLFTGLATLWELASPFLHRGEKQDLKAFARRVLARGVPPLVAVLPVLAIILYFMITVDGPQGIDINLKIRIVNYLALVPLIYHSGFDKFVAIPVSVLGLVFLLDITKTWIKEKQPFDGTFLFVFAAYFLLLMTVPSGVSGSVIIFPRLMFFVFLALIIAIASFPLPLQALRFNAAVLIVVSLFNLGYRYWEHGRSNDYIAEYLSAAHLIKPNSTVLSLTLERVTNAREISMLIKPLLHAAGYLVVDRHVVYLKNFQAAHGNFFPIYYRPELNPFKQLSPDLEKSPPRQVNLDYPEGVAGRVDYVLLWGEYDLVRDHPYVTELMPRLERDYVLIDISEKRQLMRLYRRKTNDDDRTEK